MISLSADEFRKEPGRYRTILDRVRRDSEKVAKLKFLYDNRCQLCGARLASGDGTGYSEVHHLDPLGSPHDGPDDVSNMLVLCLNHNADFDNGVVRVALDDLSIEHPYDSEVNGTHLSVESEHKLFCESLQYHMRGSVIYANFHQYNWTISQVSIESPNLVIEERYL